VIAAGDLAAALASPLPPPGVDHADLVRAWRAARDDALAAYGAWSASSRAFAADAYAVYAAAEAREAVAADALRRWAAAAAR
jgi:hypothetical protein